MSAPPKHELPADDAGLEAELARWPLEALAARVVVPVLDLRPGADAPRAGAPAARALVARGVGGLILFGGAAETLPGVLADLRAAAPDALLVGSDLERGVGQQVRGAAALPPLAAVGAADREDLARAAGAALAREALALGIDWIFGPVLDLAHEPRNPIVGSRALGRDPARVAALGAAYVQGIEGAGALACAKHFPGHGGTLVDSHDGRPTDARPEDELRARDLAPFRAAAEAGVASVMTAHVAFPGLSPAAPAGLPATLDPALVDGLLRRELGFSGLVVTDALLMDGVRAAAGSEAQAGVLALEAGCDALLYPREPEAVIEAVAAWARGAPERAARLREAARRVLAAARRAARARAGAGDGGAGRPGEAGARARASGAVGLALARVACARSGAALPPLPAAGSSGAAPAPGTGAGAGEGAAGGASAGEAPGAEVGLVVLDDDDVPGLGHELAARLAERGVVLVPATVVAPQRAAGGPPAGVAAPGLEAGRGPEARAAGPLDDAEARLARALACPRVVAAVGCRVRAWKGRAGLHPDLAAVLARLPAGRTTVVALCGAHVLALDPAAGRVAPHEVLWAWGDDAACQQAAADALLGAPAPGRPPSGLAPGGP